MKYINVTKDSILNDKEFKKSGFYICWDGSDKVWNMTDEEKWIFIKNVAPSIKDYFYEYGVKIKKPSALKRCSSAYCVKHHFQMNKMYSPYEGRPFYSSYYAFILVMLEAGLDVIKENCEHGRYIIPYKIK